MKTGYIITLVLTAINVSIVIVSIVSRGSSNKDLIEAAQENGKLTYEVEIMKWAIANDVHVDRVYLDSAYSHVIAIQNKKIFE